MNASQNKQRKIWITSFFTLFLFFASESVWGISSQTQGVIFNPSGRVAEPLRQIQVQFPEEMEIPDHQGFKIDCNPQVSGFVSWASNNTIWTYNLKSIEKESTEKLPGGAQCTMSQMGVLKSVQGKEWAAGTLKNNFYVSGPNVVRVIVSPDFRLQIREETPVVMILFDGPVDRDQFFRGQNAYLSYKTGSTPKEKIQLQPLPEEHLREVFNYYNSTEYDMRSLSFESKYWVLATVNRKLIPGSQLALNVEKTPSALESGVVADLPYHKDLKVRELFNAQVSCPSLNSSGTPCLPNETVDVTFNNKVKWADVSQSYIEYIPYDSKNKKTVRVYAQYSENKMGEDGENSHSWVDSAIKTFLNQFSSVNKFFSEPLVDTISFKFDPKIEPNTTARVVLPDHVVDIDGRKLSSSSQKMNLKFGSREETIVLPPSLSVFERGSNSDRALSVAVVNLNQKIKIRASGLKKDKNSPGKWSPISDIKTMINLIGLYQLRGEYRTSKDYKSPLNQASIPSYEETLTLKGPKNRGMFIQVPFGKNSNGQLGGGMYALEISSPTYEKQVNGPHPDHFVNPQYTLAQVTDLSVHLRKGIQKTLIWVTRLSSGEPVSHAQLEVYNCRGEKVIQTQANEFGISSIDNIQKKKDFSCSQGDSVYSPYFEDTHFYVVARTKDDFALAHSSWTDETSYSAFYAKGVEFYYSKVEENTPYFHGIVGVNLVKPGQSIPIEIVAKIPKNNGFADVPESQLPKVARIQSDFDENVSIDFNIKWNLGHAQLDWQVPKEGSVLLGTYSLFLVGSDPDQITKVNLENGIEVAEFKVPLLTGVLSVPNFPLVQPDSIPITGTIRYANQMGASHKDVSISYYFEPTLVQMKKYKQFKFGSGPAQLTSEETEVKELPDYNRPMTVENLKTSDQGTVSLDIAQLDLNSGKKVAEVLKHVKRPQHLVTRLRYQDQTGEFQTLTQGKDVLNAQSFIGMNLRSSNETQQKGAIEVMVVSANEENITARSQMKFNLNQIKSTVLSEQLFGGLIKSSLKREFVPVEYQGCVSQSDVYTCTFDHLQKGSFALEASDSGSGQVSHTFFNVDEKGHVYGQDEYYFEGDQNSKYLLLTLNKKQYKEGEKALVSFAPPFKTCMGLVTVEKSDVMSAFVAPHACESGSVELPVDVALAPNAFVSVYLVSGRVGQDVVALGDLDLGKPSFRQGYANMLIGWDAFQADVQVKIDKEKYEPGEQVNVQVSVEPKQGDLVSGQVTLVTLEEKILDLKKNNTYQILDSLMQLRSHEVNTSSLLNQLYSVSVTESADHIIADARKGGDEGGDGGLKDNPFKREIFDALVNFQTVPVINGTAQASFKTNGNLTRFKVFAIVSSKDKFGLGTSSYFTEKESQATLIVPSIGRSGDQYPVRVDLQNNSSKQQYYRIEVTAQITNSSGEIINQQVFNQDISVEKNQPKELNIGSLTLPDEGYRVKYTVRLKDSTGKLLDVSEPEPQRVYPAIPLALHKETLEQVSSNGSLVKDLKKEDTALLNKGEIKTILSASLVDGAKDQLVDKIRNNQLSDFLIEFALYKALFPADDTDHAELKSVLEKIIIQTDENGFVKFYSGSTKGSVWFTAHLINVLNTQPWAIELIPTALNRSWKKAVQSVLNKTVSPEYYEKSKSNLLGAQIQMGRAAFALKDKTLISVAKNIFKQFDEELLKKGTVGDERVDQWPNVRLVDYWLYEVMVKGAEAKKSPALTQLLNASRLNRAGNVAKLQNPQEYFGGYLYTDGELETSKLLYGLSLMKLDSDADLARDLVNGMVSDMRGSLFGMRTRTWGVIGLNEFSHAFETHNIDTDTDKTRITFTSSNKTYEVDWANKEETHYVRTDWKDDAEQVIIKHNGNGSPWVTIQAFTAIPLKEPISQGVSLTKEIRNLNHENGNLRAGDIVEVTLKIDASVNINHFVVSDPIPGGSSIVGKADGYIDSGEKSYKGYKFYIGMLPQGTSEIKYRFQMNNTGYFHLPPTRAEGVYVPSIFAETPNKVIEVK